MEYRRLGSTGLKVSRICLGCMGFGDAERWIHKWVLNEEDSRPIIKKALELGINFFDTANIYAIGKSEEILGRALNDVAKRDEVVIATKVFSKMRFDPNGAGLSRKAIMSEISWEGEAATAPTNTASRIEKTNNRDDARYRRVKGIETSLPII